MNFKKIVSAVAAAAVAVSAMAVSTFALSTKDYTKLDGKNATVFINADKPEDPTWAIDAGVAQTDVYGVTFHVTFDNDCGWYGGGIGANSNSTGWKSIEWGTNSKPITADVDAGTITWLSDSPVFAEDDAYAQLWMQTWSGDVTVLYADILGAGGTVIATNDEAVAAAAEAAAAEEEAAVEETAAVEEVEDTADEEADVVEDVVDVAEDDVVDVVDDVDDAADVDVADDAADVVVDDAPVADSTTTPVKTGNASAAVILSVLAVAGAAAVVAKRK